MYKDKVRMREYNREYYHKNKERDKEKNREKSHRYLLKHRTEMTEKARNNYRIRRREWLDVIRNLNMDKCSRCGYGEHFCAIEFHHVDPITKMETISRLMKNKPTPKLINELKKCIPVCSNCHKVIHFGSN